jgi:hypothetical protein
MSGLGQNRKFAGVPATSGVEGEADVIWKKADIDTEMSGLGGKGDVPRRRL